ncbi:unnamed protein product [Arctia plantaginis]|uniref:Uncharacterized protein n=1 Tax=Arctia plantaginis TaxID=874455 RepID=A0A8S0YSG7_ARCPL|nr:unnamed protein product [Arctia plantaginis]
MWGSLSNFLSPSGIDLDNISEAIRINRCKRTEGKGGWKVLPKDSWDLYNKYKKRRQTVKKDIKTKKKSEKPKSNSKRPRARPLIKSKKLIRKRKLWVQVNNNRKKKNLKRMNTKKRTYKRPYGQSKRKPR